MTTKALDNVVKVKRWLKSSITPIQRVMTRNTINLSIEVLFIWFFKNSNLPKWQVHYYPFKMYIYGCYSNFNEELHVGPRGYTS